MIGTFVLGLAVVLLLKLRDRPVYDAIGRTVLEESHTRSDLPSQGGSAD